MNHARPYLAPSAAQSFEIRCAGGLGAQLAAPGRADRARAGLRPSGAASVAEALARAGARVGLVATLEDEPATRALLDELASLGVDLGGVAYVGVERVAGVAPALALVDGDLAAPFALETAAARPIAIPAGWS